MFEGRAVSFFWKSAWNSILLSSTLLPLRIALIVLCSCSFRWIWFWSYLIKASCDFCCRCRIYRVLVSANFFSADWLSKSAISSECVFFGVISLGSISVGRNLKHNQPTQKTVMALHRLTAINTTISSKVKALRLTVSTTCWKATLWVVRSSMIDILKWPSLPILG